jgi:hypothetical protein
MCKQKKSINQHAHGECEPIVWLKSEISFVFQHG